MHIIISFFLLFLFFIPQSAPCAIVQINGKWCSDKYAPTLSILEHYEKGCASVQQENWEEGLNNFLIITTHFPESPFYKDSLFYSGVCYYFCGELDLANQQFTSYLSIGTTLKYFENALEFKYHIANQFADGSKKHLFGVKGLPKWAGAKEDALLLYDEVISSLPSSEIAVWSFYGKAQVLLQQKKYRESIEALTTLAKRFPKHELAPESYLMISNIYFKQCENEPQNPDLIGLAKINLERFQKNFPSDERVEKLKDDICKMQEIYAQTLYNIAKFYERKGKPKASCIYYQEAVRRYPGTTAGQKSRDKLVLLEQNEK